MFLVAVCPIQSYRPFHWIENHKSGQVQIILFTFLAIYIFELERFLVLSLDDGDRTGTVIIPRSDRYSSVPLQVPMKWLYTT